MAGLIDMLLAKTRFDQKNTLDNRMQQGGVPQPGVPVAPIVPPTQSAGGSVADQIRQRRAARAAERAAEEAAYLRSMGGGVMPKQY